MKKQKKEKHFIKKPIYPGGIKAMRDFIRKELVYPKEALSKNIEGVVRIKYTINKNGKVIRTEVQIHLGHGCDEEAERLVRLLEFQVPRARQVKVKFIKTINIHFKLPKPNTVKYIYTQEPKSTKEKKSSSSYEYTIMI